MPAKRAWLVMESVSFFLFLVLWAPRWDAVPHGGLYRWVSAPNYLGEILEWVGFAIAAQTLAGWAFVAFTIANLAPRARSNHQWYLAKFPDYPGGRRALTPLVW